MGQDRAHMKRASTAWLRTTAALLLALLVTACATTRAVEMAVPAQYSNQAVVPDLAHIRIWGDEQPPNLRALAAQLASGGNERHWNILALSGGGPDGAYGAGLLNGWTQSGTRPKFKVVTGISTGAIIAPFAFLGPRYDAQLKEFYTTVKTDDILLPSVVAGLLGGASLADTRGFDALIAKHTSEQMLDEIAAEAKKGRYLLIGTTNLDAQRPVIWSIGHLAASGHPRRLELFRQIIRASAAIPGAFPPVPIGVTANGKRFTELHVDGSVTNQVFAYPPQLTTAQIDAFLGYTPRRTLYIVRNSQVSPEYSPTEEGVLPISVRSIDTLLKNYGIGDLYRLYAIAQRDRLEYNLTYIPSTFTETSEELFDPKYMRKLFDLGYRQGVDGVAWRKNPPGLE